MIAFEARSAASAAERDFFEAGLPVFIGRSPGRLDLMGGNVDYTGGLVFEATIREATWAAVQLRADGRIRFLESADGRARLAGAGGVRIRPDDG